MRYTIGERKLESKVHPLRCTNSFEEGLLGNFGGFLFGLDDELNDAYTNVLLGSFSKFIKVNFSYSTLHQLLVLSRCWSFDTAAAIENNGIPFLVVIVLVEVKEYFCE